MSIIISEMEMPKFCADCDLFYDYMCCPITGTHADFEKMDSERLPNCPLTEILDNEGDTKKIEEALSIAIGALGKHNKEAETETLIKPYYDDAFVGCVQQGWQCPICNRVYSPYTPMCYYCGQAVTTTTSSGTGEPHVQEEKNE